MSKNVITGTIRSSLALAALATVLVASPAHATWSWWDLFKPGWWNSRPTPVATPEIDAGLMRSAAAIAAGGLLVLRSRKKRQS